MPAQLFHRDGPGADYEQLAIVQDEPSGLRAIVAVHSTRLGPAFGGIRRHRYANEEAALADALRLAEAMTAKCALADLPAGGGKTVVLDHPGLDRAASYRALGEAVERLGGRYVCGPDVGTGDGELAHVRAATRWVNPEGNDAGGNTARGVLAGLRGTLHALDGDPSFSGRRFVVQGLGAVGSAVARTLVADGAEVLGHDVDAAALKRAEAAGVQPLAEAAVLTTPCDVFVPCALGGVLTPEVAEKLPARAVCGSANNPLTDPDAGRRLHTRGVLYAPDFLVNAGAVIEGVLTVQEGATDAVRAKAREHVDGIEDRTRRLLAAAAEENVAPTELAWRWAMARAGRPDA